jgi:hypothetical protein
MSIPELMASLRALFTVMPNATGELRTQNRMRAFDYCTEKIQPLCEVVHTSVTSDSSGSAIRGYRAAWIGSAHARGNADRIEVPTKHAFPAHFLQLRCKVVKVKV